MFFANGFAPFQKAVDHRPVYELDRLHIGRRPERGFRIHFVPRLGLELFEAIATRTDVGHVAIVEVDGVYSTVGQLHQPGLDVLVVGRIHAENEDRFGLSSRLQHRRTVWMAADPVGMLALHGGVGHVTMVGDRLHAGRVNRPAYLGGKLAVADKRIDFTHRALPPGPLVAGEVYPCQHVGPQSTNGRRVTLRRQVESALEAVLAVGLNSGGLEPVGQGKRVILAAGGGDRD